MQVNCPLKILQNWLNEERDHDNPFPQGAVLSTTTRNGNVRSRVVGTMLNANNFPKFHTSPCSRKVDDIDFNSQVSLTYSFQHSLRSISIEGCLSSLHENELETDWLKYDEDFRRHYLVFGESSGRTIESLSQLRSQRDTLEDGAVMIRPNSFIGYKFSVIDRVSFYSVKTGEFAVNEIYKRTSSQNGWSYSLAVP
jgi:pyridoxine/pyridoxamine 5'-phosphate oxidase